LITRAQEAEIPWTTLQPLLKELEQACLDFDHEVVRELLMRLVVEYAPQCGLEDLIWSRQNTLLQPKGNLRILRAEASLGLLGTSG
jgi:hypothetical protein